MPYPVEHVPPDEAQDLDVRLKFYGDAILDFQIRPPFVAYYGDGDGILRGCLEIAGFLFHYDDLPDKRALFALMDWPTDPAAYLRVERMVRNFRALAKSRYARACHEAGETRNFSAFFRAGVTVAGLCADYSKTAIKL